MSCPYYYWNHHYACRKTGKDVNEDTYYKYCRNYDYDDCPIYKGNDSGGCYLTSACVEAKGLADDCHELTVLRSFRDTYMRATEAGRADICHYYHSAPVIVEKIRRSGDAMAVFETIYNELILPCVKLIEDARNEEAYALYKGYVLKLEKEYLGA